MSNVSPICLNYILNPQGTLESLYLQPPLKVPRSSSMHVTPYYRAIPTSDYSSPSSSALRFSECRDYPIALDLEIYPQAVGVPL